MRASTATALLLCFGAIAMAYAQAARQIINPDASRPFSGGVKSGNFVFVAGSVGTDASGGVAKGDVKAQTKQTLQNIDAILKKGGSSLANAASVTVYMRNASDFAGMNEAYAAMFPKDPPTRTTVMINQPFAAADALVEIAAVGIVNGAERQVIHPSDWVRSPAPYNYGIKSGDTLFLSGLVSRNGKDNTNVKGDMTAQTKTVLDNGAAILKQAGMTFGDVVASRVYITDETNFQAMNAAYRPYFTAGSMPARATVKTGLTSADYLVEITMVAVKEASRKAIATPNADGSMPAPNANANLSAAVQVGNRLYVSGITGNTASNKGDAKAQTTEALARIERTLKAAGYDWANVVDSTVYLSSMTDYQTMNGAYREKLMKDFPARATVGTGLMGADAAVEIMMVAAK
jgi:2-iminobutanoate/2-iminopropanoate deaminase